MKKLVFTLFSLLFAVSFLTAQNLNVLAINGDNANVEEFNPVLTAFQNSGYPVTSMHPQDTTQIFDSLATGHYNFVFWYAGGDGIDSLLWKYHWGDVDTQPVQPYAFYDQITNYILNGNIFWLDGIDVIYDVYGGAPDEFQQGDYVYDILGIKKYVAQSHKDDGTDFAGVPYLIKDPNNTINTVDTIKWTYSSLWFVDAYSLREDAHPLYEMGGADENYPLAGDTSSYYRYNLIYTNIRLGKVVRQGMLDSIVKDILDAAANGVFQPMPVPAYTSQVSNIKFSVFPNPAHSYLHVSAPELTNGELTVTDLEGRSIYQTKFNKFKTLYVGDFEPGIYVVKIRGNKGTVTHKLIIK